MSQRPPVPSLSADQVAVLRAWCATEADVHRAWVFGSRVRGWRRDPSKATPPDIDVAVALLGERDNPHGLGDRRLPRLKESLQGYVARYPHLFGRTKGEADYVELRDAAGEQVQGFMEADPTSLHELFDRSNC